MLDCKEFFEFAAVEPDAATLGTGIDDHGFIDRAVNPQQCRAITRALPLLAVGLILAPAAQQGRHVTRVFGEQLAQLVSIKPDAVAGRASVNSHPFDGDFADIFYLAFW